MPPANDTTVRRPPRLSTESARDEADLSDIDDPLHGALDRSLCAGVRNRRSPKCFRGDSPSLELSLADVGRVADLCSVPARSAAHVFHGDQSLDGGSAPRLQTRHSVERAKPTAEISNPPFDGGLPDR